MRAEVRLLGTFEVLIDGVATPATGWSRRSASSLVKLLALSSGRRLHRDRVIDTIWPELSVEAALPRLHKAAHYARVALGRRTAVVLHDEMVALFPGDDVVVDAETFEAEARSALREVPPSPDRCGRALDRAGELLPDDLALPWLDEPRDRLRLLTARLQAVTLPAPAAAPAPPEPAPPEPALPEPALPEPALLERDEELARMTTAVRSAVASGRGVVLLIGAEAGGGKSALVRALLGRLDPGLTVFAAGCDDLLAPRSLGPFRDMAEDHPAMAGAIAAARLDEALPAMVKALSASRSIVVIEDVHWADDATLDAIRYLARRLPRFGGVLVLTYRDAEVDDEHPLRQVLGSLTSIPVERVTLRPLSEAAVRCLGATSPQQAAEIARVTAGNPFFVTEVLAAGSSGVPPTVRDAVLARLGRLPPPVRALVRRLSVVPTRADRLLAERLADGDRSLVVEAERSGVVVAGKEWISFRHELARQAVETSLLPGMRIEANRLVLEALLERPDVEPTRVVHHAERAGQTDTILRYAPRAAREAGELGAHRQAAEVLRVVLEHSSLLAGRQLAELSTRRAYSLYVVNRYEAAFRCAEAAVGAAETAGDPVLLADALVVLGRVAMFARGPARARAAAARAVELLRAGSDLPRLAAALTELARTHSNLATVGIVAEPSGAAATYAEEALGLAGRLGLQDIAAQAYCYLGDARLAAGEARGADDLERAISLAGSDRRVENQVRAYVNAAGGAYRSGRFEQAERYVAAGLAAAADGEFFAGEYRLRLTAATVAASRGDWDAAVDRLRTLLAAPGEPGVMAVLARSVLSRLLARRGDPEGATVLAAALADPAFADDSFVGGVLTVASVELGWLDGSLGGLTAAARRGLQLTLGRHRSVHAELCAYLRRAEVDVPPPSDPPGPWGPTLADRWQEAAAAWAALGDRYEHAVVLATAPDRRARADGARLLEGLGAAATLAAV